MEELDVATITKRSIKGVLALVSRTFFIQIIALVSNFLLTIFLDPRTFGVFFVVSAVIAFLAYFSDIGLAAALIQKKEQITKEDLRTTFTVQQLLVLSIVFIAFLLSPLIRDFYNLEGDGLYLFYALLISFFMSSLKTIPSILLERDLRFEKLVIPQIVETIAFNVIAVVLAIRGFGISSFTYAVLARGLTGLLAMYIIAPWKIEIGISRSSFKKLLSFGVPFQLNSILALIKDDLLVVYLGKVLPLGQVGYIGFAQKWAFTPLRLIMDNIIRITFPSFSRLQDQKDALKKATEKSIFASTLFIFPSVFGIVLLSSSFIEIIPRYSKWEPALFSLAFFGINAAFSSISTPLTNVLNAIGKIRLSLYFMIFWTASTWILTPLLIMYYGFNGVALASALISLSSLFVIFVAKKYVSFDTIKVVKFPLLSSIFMGTVVYLLRSYFAESISGLIFLVAIGIISYFSFLLVFAKREVLSDLRLIRENLRL